MATASIFIRRIPETTSTKELKEFVEGGISWMVRLRSGFAYKIVSVKILTHRQQGTTITEYHGLITIEPDTVVDQIINRLRFKPFKGQKLLVKRYYHRTSVNDRRDRHGNPNAYPGKCARGKDRRIQVQVMVDLDVKATGPSRKLI